MSDRILLITETMFPLGPAGQLTILARELVQRDFEVHIAILNDEPSSAFRLPGDCHIHHLEIQKRDLLAWQKLRKLAKRIDPLVCHDWSAEWITRAAIGDLYPHLSSQFNAPQRPDVMNWLRQRWIRRKSPALPNYASTHELVTQSILERGVPNEQIATIPPAIEKESVGMANARQFILSQFGLAEDSVIVGTFAPLIPATRIKDLIWAVDLISCIRDDVQLLVMGSGGQLSRLHRFLRCTASRSHVHFVGCPVRAPEVISGLDVYWNSHVLWPLPTSLLMAMNFGVPAISVLGPETASVIQHQATGFGTNLGARDEFARWTKYLIEQVEPAKQLAKQGQDLVRAQFSREPFVDAYVELYKRIR